MVAKKAESEEDMTRKLFHSTRGGIDYARMLENFIPVAVAATMGVYANYLVVRNQLDDVRAEVAQLRLSRDVVTSQIVGLQAQMVSFIGTQNQLNDKTDSRLLYIERLPRSRQ